MVSACIRADDPGSEAKPEDQKSLPFKWETDIDSAKARARATGRPILLNFTGSDWCVYCSAMDRDVFSTREWAAYASRLIPVMIDIPQGRGVLPGKTMKRNKKLYLAYGVEAPPMYVILDSDGETVIGRTGYYRGMGVYDFVQRIGVILRSKSKQRSDFSSGMTKVEAERYGNLADLLEAATEEFSRWMETDPPVTAVNQEKFTAHNVKIRKLESQVVDMEMAYVAGKIMGKDSAATVKTLRDAKELVSVLDELREASKDLEGWLVGKPDSSPESRAIADSLLERVEKAKQELKSPD